MIELLIVSVTSVIVGLSEVKPGLCKVDYLVDSTSIRSELINCNKVRNNQTT